MPLMRLFRAVWKLDIVLVVLDAFVSSYHFAKNETTRDKLLLNYGLRVLVWKQHINLVNILITKCHQRVYILTLYPHTFIDC